MQWDAFCIHWQVYAIFSDQNFQSCRVQQVNGNSSPCFPDKCVYMAQCMIFHILHIERWNPFFQIISSLAGLSNLLSISFHCNIRKTCSRWQTNPMIWVRCRTSFPLMTFPVWTLYYMVLLVSVSQILYLPSLYNDAN